MRNNRKIVLILILALAIGFAGISTMLRIGGQAKVGFNQEQFEADIIFTRSILDEEDVSDATIIESGKKIRFETKKLTTVGESTVLDYTVTNKSSQYGARGHVKTFEYDPEYIRVENAPNDFDLLPQSNSLGKLTITLIKPLLEDKDTEVIIEIEVDPIDPGDVTTTTTTETTTTTTTTTEEIDDGKTKYNLIIDPDGGVYNGSSEIINTKVVENTNVTLDKVTKEGYIFSHWEVNEEILETEEITITGNTTIKAVWIPISEAVARINEVYYLSIQSAFDAAKTNDEVVLLKDTEEEATNKKNIVFNLNSHKVTGFITNTGDLRIDNGEIENTNGSAITNTGTLTLGNNEGNVSITSPSIIGTDIGIEQKGTLNFYDGVVEGKIGINGDVAKTPEEYFVFVDHNDEKDAQKVYLVKELTRAVAKTITNGTVYYFNLQDGINSSSLTEYKIYAIRDFEAPYELNIKEGENITFDITGYTVELGNAITNNGTLTLIDSGDEKGELKPSVAITNNGVLNVNNISISQTTDAQVIINKKDINITNSTLTGKGGNALELMGEATLNMDDNSYLKSNQWSLYLHDIDTTISSGNIKGIYIETTASLTLEGGYIFGDEYRSNLQVKGNLTVNGGIVENTNKTGNAYAIYDEGNYDKKTVINGGTIIGNGTNGVVRMSPSQFEMNGGTIKNENESSSGSCLTFYRGSKFEINGGTLIQLGNQNSLAISVDATSGTINNVEIHSNGDGVHVGYWYACKVTINNINIVECKESGLIVEAHAQVTINDGIFRGKKALSLSSYNLTVISSGEFYGTEYGIYITSNYVNIGIEDDEIKEKPLIVGDKYGIYATSAYRYFDGIIKGITDAKNKEPDALPSKFIIKETEEVIDGETYIVNNLVEQENYLEVNDIQYNSLAEAILASGEEGTIKLINNGKNSSYTEILETQNINLDLNGYTLTTSQNLAVNGSLTIDDTSESKTGKIYSTYDRSVLYINGNLTINGGTIENTNTGLYARAILSDNNSSNKKITINGGEIKSTSQGETIYINYGSFEMNGGIIRNASTNSAAALGLYNNSYAINGGTIYKTNYTGSYTAVYVNGNGTINNLEIHSSEGALKMAGGTSTINNINIVECGYYGIEISSGNTTINDGIIKGKTGIYNSNSYGGVLTINGGTIDGTQYGIMNSWGTVTINGGNISGTEYGIFINTSEWYRAGVNLGSDDEEIKTTPVVVGGKYGIYNQGVINFYDGIIKGTTDAANTSYNALPDAHVINEAEEIINEQTYKVHTLTEQGNYLKVNNVEYNSLKKAVEAIEENGTIELISNGNNTSYIEIPTGKNVTIDLKGYTLTTTKEISNYGPLTIQDSSEEQTGKITTNKNIWLIMPKGVLIINSGIIENTNGGTSARVISNIDNIEGKKVVINGGEIRSPAREGTFILQYGSFEMNGGIIRNSSTNSVGAVQFYIGSYVINGGTIYKTNSSSGYALKTTGTGTINNLELHSSGYALESSGTLTINNINIVESGYYGINASGNITINDGIVKGRYAINHGEGTLNINGGNFHGTEYGIYNYGGVTNIGENDGNIKTTPVIVGDKYGVYNSSTVRFYDGIIKGVTDAANNYTSLADSAMLITDTETIDEKAYITNTLAIQTDFVQNGDKNYNNLKTAIDEANSGDTLTITSDAFVYYNISVPEDKELSIDLNGNKLTTTVTFVNNGNMTIKDNSTTKGGTIEVLKAINLINNNKILNLEDVSLINNISSSNYALYNSNGASTTLNNSNINGKRPINNLGYLEMNDSSVFSNGEEAITNNGDAELVSNNTNVNSTNDYSIYNAGTATINSGKYYGYSTTVYQSSYKDLSIMNATIGSENKPSSIYVSAGNMNLQESTIYGSVGLYATNKDYVISKTNFILSNDLNNKTYFIDNRSNLILNECTMQFIINNGWYDTLKAIYNVGTVNGNNNTITMKNVRTDNTSYMYTPFRGVDNTGVLNLNNTSINIDKGSDAFGIRTSGNNSSATLNDLHVNITNSQNAYGIYVDGSNVTLEGSSEDTIDVSATNAYGVYINGGSFTLGTKDESETSGTENASVSITNPLIKAVGTNTGIGVRKVNGLFNYYDGKIMGSTNASPDTTSSTEPYYEVSRKTDSESGYEYAILEYMR